MKSIETSNQLEFESITDKKYLAKHHPVLVTVITQSQMHVQIKHSLVHLQDLISTFAGVFCIATTV